MTARILVWFLPYLSLLNTKQATESEGSKLYSVPTGR